MYNMSTSKLLETYDKILRVNITNDSYTIIKYDSNLERDFVSKSKTISDWFSAFAVNGNVYSEDVPIFKKYTSLAYLSEFFKTRNNHWVQYRRRYGTKYCWCEMLMLAAEDYSDDNQSVYLFIKRMNDANAADINNQYFVGSKKVLVVDDNPHDREVLKDIVMSACDVLVADSRQSASDIMREHYEDIVAVIGCLGDEDTMVDIIKLVRKNSRYDSLPLIVAAKTYSQEMMMKYLECGAFDVVVKPYNAALVRNKVNNMLKLKYSMSMLNTLKTDPLTGLYTKEFFFKKVEEILELNPGKSYRMICTDIEDFRMINENHGAELGDKVLQYISAHIGDVLPNVIVGGRLSGDVFAFLRDDIPFKYNVDAWKRFRHNSPVPSIVVKYGLSTVDRSLTVQMMCDHAVEAAKSIKHMYGQAFAEYTTELQQKKQRESMIVDHMDEAVVQKQFEIYYQPKLDLVSNKICGAEALIRWHHPDFGFLSPAEFIPLFEKNGFIRNLDMYVFDRVCNDICDWIDNGFNVVPVSINLSRVDFEDSVLLQDIESIRSKYGVDTSLIHFEVTESLFSSSVDQIASLISSLRQSGYVIELDDFGSGYSSLTMLNNIEIDVLKIDKSILNNGSNSDNKILQFCIQLARILELKTVVEGVETKQQLDELKSMGCDSVQGYYYSKPLPKNQFNTFLLI